MTPSPLLAAILALVLQVQLCRSCSCEEPNLRRMFCRAKYAAIVTLGSAAKQLDDGLYSAHAMKVRHVLRSSGDEAERAMAAEVLFTRKRRNSCALDIVVKGTYVIFGEPTTDGRAVANTCNAINVDLLTDAEKGQLEQFTKHGVPCR